MTRKKLNTSKFLKLSKVIFEHKKVGFTHFYFTHNVLSDLKHIFDHKICQKSQFFAFKTTPFQLKFDRKTDFCTQDGVLPKGGFWKGVYFFMKFILKLILWMKVSQFSSDFGLHFWFSIFFVVQTQFWF